MPKIFKISASVPSSLLAREEERRRGHEEQREVNELNKAPEESPLAFFVEFRAALEAIAAETLAAKEAKDGPGFAAVLARIREWHAKVAGAAHYLPAYDLRQAQEGLKAAEGSVAQARAEAIPKKKFTFANKQQQQQQPAAAATNPPPPAPSTSSPSSSSSLSSAPAPLKQAAIAPGLRGLSGETLAIRRGTVNGGDFELSSLTGCRISIADHLGALRVTNLSDCVVKCGPVAGAVFIEGCTNCTFFLATRQIRIHATRRSCFYVLVASTPIIEDCSEVGFGPDRLAYPAKAELLAQAGFDPNMPTDKWAKVDDFKWLKQQQSPNWHIIPEQERQPEQDMAT